MNEPYDALSREGVAKEGNTILGFIPTSVEFHLGSNAPLARPQLMS